MGHGLKDGRSARGLDPGDGKEEDHYCVNGQGLSLGLFDMENKILRVRPGICRYRNWVSGMSRRGKKVEGVG